MPWHNVGATELLSMLSSFPPRVYELIFIVTSIVSIVLTTPHVAQCVVLRGIVVGQCCCNCCYKSIPRAHTNGLQSYYFFLTYTIGNVKKTRTALKSQINRLFRHLGYVFYYSQNLQPLKSKIRFASPFHDFA